MNIEEDLINTMEEIIKSGLYKMVDLDFLTSVKNIKISNDVLELERNFLENYQEYLENIKTLPKELQILYLKALKNQETVNNHSLEKVDSFMVSMYMLTRKKIAIDKFLEIDEPITSLDFKNLHYTLLKDTPSNQASLKYRETNTIFVGYFINDKRKIEYIPIDYKLIPSAVQEILNFYNEEETNLEFAFLKPILIHGLIAGSQIFKDGNTRLARMFQHVLFFNMTKKFLDQDLKLPAIYTSNTYLLYRNQYRDLIKRLVIDNDNEIWNKWLKFNYHRFEDQLIVNNQNLKILKKTL